RWFASASRPMTYGSIQDALTLAQQLAHPFMLVHALDFAAWLHLYRREGQRTREQAEADIALATEHKIALFLAHGTIFRAWALLEQGRSTEGITQIREGLAAYRATGAECERPYLLALLAEAYGKVEQPEARSACTGGGTGRGPQRMALLRGG